MDRVMRFFITLTMVIAGGALFKWASPLLAEFITVDFFQMDTGIFRLTLASLTSIIVGAISGGIAGWFVSPFCIRKLRNFTSFVEKQLSKMPIYDVVAGAIGLALGLIIANLLGNAFSRIPVVGDYIPIIFSIVLGYLGIHLTIKKRKELSKTFDFMSRLKEVLKNRVESQNFAENDDSNFKFALKNWDKFNLFGFVIRVDKKIVAYIIDEVIEKNLISPFAKADYNFKGANQFAYWYDAKINLERGFLEENIMDDVGEENLRFFKERLRPKAMLKKFIVTYK